MSLAAPTICAASAGRPDRNSRGCARRIAPVSSSTAIDGRGRHQFFDHPREVLHALVEFADTPGRADGLQANPIPMRRPRGTAGTGAGAGRRRAPPRPVARRRTTRRRPAASSPRWRRRRCCFPAGSRRPRRDRPSPSAAARRSRDASSRGPACPECRAQTKVRPETKWWKSSRWPTAPRNFGDVAADDLARRPPAPTASTTAANDFSE